MRVRHLTPAENVAPDGSLVDPLAVRHGLIVGGRVAALAGPIDPPTHFNADFEEHGLDRGGGARRPRPPPRPRGGGESARGGGARAGGGGGGGLPPPQGGGRGRVPPG